MQARPEQASTVVAQMVEGLDTGVVGATQVQRDVDECVVGGDVGVYAEERRVAGVAAAEGVMSGTGKRRIGNQFLVMGNRSVNTPQASATTRIGWRLYAGW